MIKWCSHCSHFIRECEPWDDFQISHGVCQACFQRTLDSGAPDLAPFREIKRFFHATQRMARSGSGQVEQILAESRRLEIPPMDLLLGILQPLLAEIGELWATGQVSVATEHRFSALVGELTATLQRAPQGAPPSASPRVILVNAESNDHVLGLRMAEVFFAASGIPALMVTPGLPAWAVLELAARHRPRVVGFSVALPAQLPQVLEATERLRALPVPPRHLLLGGPAVRLGLVPDPASGLRVCRELSEVPPLLD